MTDNISGKTIVITGASSGMGAAAALHLARMGGSIVLGARRTDRIAALAEEIVMAGGRAVAVQTDVTRREDLQRLIGRAIDAWGRIDVLVNNAGVMPLSPVDRLKIDEWDAMIDVNFRGVLYGVGAALPYMMAQKAGHIVNVASVAGHKVFNGSAVYSATKFAVRAFSEGLRQELAPHNIRTTILSPGAVRTELFDHISEQDVQHSLREFVGRIGVPAETLARIIAFAINEPDDVGVNEILFRPTVQEL